MDLNAKIKGSTVWSIVCRGLTPKSGTVRCLVPLDGFGGTRSIQCRAQVPRQVGARNGGRISSKWLVDHGRSEPWRCAIQKLLGVGSCRFGPGGCQHCRLCLMVSYTMLFWWRRLLSSCFKPWQYVVGDQSINIRLLMACQNAGHEHCTMIQYTMLYNDKTTEKSNSNT